VPECRQLKSRRWEHRAILESCVTHEPDTAAIALHDHLATTANNISKAMGGEALFPLEG
jgi:DNA-binding FadR family transcriptional regulator